MASAVVGDDVFRDDPSILELGSKRFQFSYLLIFLLKSFNSFSLDCKLKATK